MQPTPTTSPPQSPRPRDDDSGTTYSRPPHNTGSAPFAVLVGLFDKLQSERKQDRRRKYLGAWFNHWRREKGYDLFPVLRLILPQKDRERALYGLKEKNLAKTYIKMIPLGMKDPDAIRLLNWKRPSEREKASGEFSTVLYEVVSKRSSVIEGSLSVDDLNDLLDELSYNMGKQDVQSKILQRIYNRATPEEQRWIVRIILKDMNISVKETTVLSVFHPDAQDLYNTCSDLKKVAWELWDPTYRLNADDKAVQLFHVFAPMLCKRPTKRIEDSVKEMGGAEFVIEEKLDGERMQLHKRGNEYFYCSRKGKDYTYLYGKHIGIGSLTPFIDKAFDPRVDDIILDGEMLVWDPVSERNLPFGTLKTAALDKSKKELHPRPCFKIFDLLYLNGQSLLHRSLTFRKKNLRSCITEISGRLEFTVEYKGKTAKDVRERMDEIMASRGEGLILKHPLSKYVLNGRNMDWIKVKPEYMDNMGETVDVLVVAGNYGSGKRGGGVSSLICAVLDDRRTLDDDDEPKYTTFVRIGSGLSFADYVWVRDKPWKKWDPDNPPDFLLTAKKSHDDKGDVYLEPQDSFILKVKAAEITPTDQYGLSFTMRFPRAMAIRDDLNIADCMTATDVLDSIRTEKKRKMESDDSVSKKRKTTAKKPAMLPEYKGLSKRKIEVESNIFDGMKFVVMSDPKSRTGADDKESIVKLIYANGGSCAQVAANQPDLLIVYGGKTIPYDLKLLIDKDVYDVIKPNWITNSVARGIRVPFRSKYFFHATSARVATHEYQESGSEEETPPTENVPAAESERRSTTPETMKGETEPDVDIDPAFADWFRVEQSAAKDKKDEAESVTDADSENADVAPDAEVEVDDDWFNLKMPAEVSDQPQTDARSSTLSDHGSADVKMGEDDAMEYDVDQIFMHLCFYLDTPHNARQNGMTVKTKYESDIEDRFGEIKKQLEENGGRIGNLDDPKLTHVVIDKRDDSRRLELMRRTSKPKRRHLVVSEFVQACLEEGTLLDEEAFAP